MRLLLDTHVFLWLQTEPERLGAHLPVIESPSTELLLSAASAWEIAIKSGLGRLILPEPPDHYVPTRMRAIGAQAVRIEQSHALTTASLPPLHRDPFDRMLVAQAQALDATLITADSLLAEYPITTLLIGAPR